MQPRSSLAATLTADETTVGTVLQSVSPNVAEALGYTPVEFLFVDHQHGSPVVESIEHIVRAADLNDLPVVVRVPHDDASMTTYLLDLGVRGIMLPQVESADTVREASTHVRYRDGRSLGSSTRAAKFGAVPKRDYADHVNDDLALLPMVETVDGMDTAAAVASLDETTALTIGPGDLAWSLDVPFGSDEHRAAIDRIFEVGEANDCPVGLFVTTPGEIERYRDRAAFLVYNADVSVLTDHYDAVLGDR